MSNRKLSWNCVLRDLKSGRAPRAEVREERLKSTAGLREAPAMQLSAWRGRSGLRYVVGVHAISAFETDDLTGAVCIAIKRDAKGIAQIISVVSGMDARMAQRWADKARAREATEIHVHRLAETADERAAIVSDLKPAA